MRSLGLPLLAACLASTPAFAQRGPGLGNRAWAQDQLFRPVGYIESPHGHGNVTMVQGYLMDIYSSDGGGEVTNGGIEFWDVSNPASPRRVVQWDTPETHLLRESHGYALAWYGTRLLLAAQGEIGIMIWDVTDPRALRLVTSMDLPDIDPGDYSGDWWVFWQAPYLFVAGTGSGLFVIDATMPEAPAIIARMSTGQLGGVSPAQVFALGNLAVVMESQGRGLASIDISVPDHPQLIQQLSGRAGYSHIFAGPGKILTSGNVPPRAHVFDVTHEGAISYVTTIGFYLNSGGYGSYQDGIFHSGFSDHYQKFRLDPPGEAGDGTSGREGRDEDFATVLGNVVFVGDDHGVGSAIIPHQAAPDTNPPVVEWMHPASGTTGLPTSTRVGLSFSDHIDSSSLDATTIKLLDPMGNPVPARLSVQMGLVNVAPVDALGLLTTYTLVAEGVRDLAGNRSARFEGTFTTGESASSQAPAAVENVEVSFARGRYALGVFGAGKRVYSDRNYTFTTAYPARAEGKAYIQTANDDRGNLLSSFLTFDLLAPAEVLVLYDARATALPNWLRSWTATGETVVDTDTTLNVYSKSYPMGQVELGANSALGARGAMSMYSVVIVTEPVPCTVDLAPVATGTVALSAMGPANGGYAWRVDGRTLMGASPNVYLAPGRHSVFLTTTRGPLSATCGGVKIAHRPLVAEAQRARVSGTIAWHRGSTISVNQDSGSVTRADPITRRVLWESRIPGSKPAALAVRGDEVWVADRAGARVAVLAAETGQMMRAVALPRASQPAGIVFSPDGAAYVTLAATGEVVKLDAAAGRIAARRQVAPTAQGLTWFGGKLYVTRFLSPDTRGEVYVLDAATLDARGMLELAYDHGADTEASGRGVPNYVAEVQISPDGTLGWVASKKDNIGRGMFLDGRPLNFESRVRTIVSTFDVATSTETRGGRLDINDRDLVQATLPSPYGDLLFVVSTGANIVDVFDVVKGERISQFSVGRAPRGIALDPATGKLAVQNFMSRTVSYYDVAGLIAGTSNGVTEIGSVSTVANELLSAQALEGKKIFYDASDDRMSRDNYQSCASCHLDGGHDGRTWDFTQAGEGLRSTIPLVGRAGTRHGRVHWTANFDEIQDFENDIRSVFGGTGFMSDADFAATRDPLGPPKAGKSRELDALAAFLATLELVPASPHRADDGTLTVEARRGREVFVAADCQRCHSGAAFSDFQRHDVGTIRPSSGRGIGQPLAGAGFETPTLLGIWESAPYLHDGSAPTLDEALRRHGEIPAFAGAQRADLLAYLAQLDSSSLAPEAPCGVECVGAPPPPDAGVPARPDATTADPDASTASPDAGVTSSADAATADATLEPTPDTSSCGCSTTAAPRSSTFALLALLALATLRRRR